MTARRNRATIGPLSEFWNRGLRVLIAAALLSVVGLTPARPVFADSTQADEVHVVGRLPMQLNTSERAEFEQKTLALAKVTRQQDAVTSYSCNADIEHPGTYVFDEIWPSEQALKDHLATDHFKAWWDWVQPHLSGDLVIKVAPTADFHNFS